MPVICKVTPLSDSGLDTAGDCLQAMGAGSFDGYDLVTVPVGPGGDVAPDDALDSLLALPAADLVRAAQLDGKPGQNAQAVPRIGKSTIKIVFLGVGEMSPQALRRAGGELGRLLQPGDRALATVVAGQTGEQVRAFAEGLLLGSHRYSEKSTAGDGLVAAAEVQLLLPTAIAKTQ